MLGEKLKIWKKCGGNSEAVAPSIGSGSNEATSGAPQGIPPYNFTPPPARVESFEKASYDKRIETHTFTFSASTSSQKLAPPHHDAKIRPSFLHGKKGGIIPFGG